MSTVAPGTMSALLAELARPPPPAEPHDVGLAAGTVIGRFELVRPLGRGGFGEVWEARDRELGRAVAFKLVRPQHGAHLAEKQVLREAEAAARLAHDNIVALYDIGRSEHGPYLVLELLEGMTLSRRLEDGPIPLPESIRIVRAVASAVAHAHAHGVVHRDLKPGNVFVCDDGRVKVVDFGLAHYFGRRCQSGGTPDYMAPEQWRGAPEDERTDVFAMGVMLYRMVAGASPFRGERDVTGRTPAPALEIADAPDLASLIARMLEKDPVRRPRDGAVVLAALDAVVGTLGSAEPGADSARVRVRWHPMWRNAGIVAAGVALGVVLLASVTWTRQRPAGAEGKDVVAVADVVNETGERDLDVLSGLLVTSLEQSRRLKVMTQARVLDLAIRAGRRDATRVDETVGREVGSAHRVRVLLLPAIRRLGRTYSLELRAIDPTRDEHLFTHSERAASKEALLDALDRLATQTRKELHEDPAELARSRVDLGAAMTRSLEAYQHYTAGLEAWLRDGLRAVALRELLRAVDLDPQFSAAHSELANLYDAYGRPDLAAPHWRNADEHIDRMPEKERSIRRLRRTYGTRSPEHWNREEALRLADDVVTRFPDDKIVLLVAAQAYSEFDAPDRHEAALRKVVTLDPGYFVGANRLATVLGDRTGDALEVARRAVATRRNAANLSLLAGTLRAAGSDDEARAVAREALRSDAGGQNSFIAMKACYTLFQVGADAECLDVWERMATTGVNEHERAYARFQMVKALAVEGRVREALRLWSAVEDANTGNPHERFLIHSVGRARLDAPGAVLQVRRVPDPLVRRAALAFFGEMAEAERISNSLGGDRFDILQKFYRHFVLRQQGKLVEAAEVMRAQAEEVRAQNNDDFLFVTGYLLAETLLEAGRAAEAAAVWPAPLPCRCVGLVEYAANYPKLTLVRARAMEQIGQRDDALRELDGLLAFWRHADDDLPLLIEAKQMRARLTSRR